MSMLRHIALLTTLACVSAGTTHAETIEEALAGISLKPARTLYWRAGYTMLKPNNRNKDVKEVGPRVVQYGDEFTPGLDPQYAQALQLLSNGIRADHPNDYVGKGLGIPDGLSVKAGRTSGFTVTMGHYLSDDHKWAVEAYVLGQPFQIAASGTGRIGGQGSDAVDLGRVITTKALGPIAYFKYTAGDADDWIRPSLGVGGYYIAFFDTRATKTLEDYSGGDTHVRIKNAYGPASFIGADLKLPDGWTLNATVGYLWLKTEATSTTQTDPAKIAVSPALTQSAKDLGPNTLTAIQIINGTTFNTADLTPAITAQLAAARTQPGQAPSLGTYTRSIVTQLNPWLLTVSVGRDF